MNGQADRPQQDDPSDRSDLIGTTAFKALDRLVRDLEDGLDHPEIWPLLADVVAAGQANDLLQVLRALRPLQHMRVGKIFDLVEALMLALGSDSIGGVTALERLEAQDGLCPQIAGALFYVTHHGSARRPPHLEGKFCRSPFEKFETLIDGTVAPCCSIWTKKRLGKLDEHSFDEIWNSTDAQEMRASILDGSFRYCNKRRCALIVENTLPDRATVTEPHLRAIIEQNQVVLAERPRWLFLAHDLTCNLACPSCRTELLGANEEERRRLEAVEHKVFHPLLESGNEMLLSISGQGDPWSSPHYRSLLRYLAQHDLNIRLNLHTNAQLMTPERWQQFAGLQRYDCAVDVSIDACTPWVYEVVRRPGKWEKLEANLRFIAAKRKAGEFREFHLNATIQLDNYHEAGDLVAYARSIGADSVRLYLIQNTGDHLADDFMRKNVARPDHPLHLAFMETLRDTRLADPVAHLYDVKSLREAAFAAELPSDRVGMDDAATALREMDAAAEQGAFAISIALAAAARIRFGNRDDLLGREADALDRLGFERQATFRRMMQARSAEAAA